MDVGKEIQKLRVSKEIKQADIAIALEIDVSSYSRLERKGNKITVEQLAIIANALGVSLSELLGLDAPVENEEKVKELKKRIEELEIQLSVKAEKLNDVEYIINEYFNYFTELAAIENDLYTYITTDTDTGEILKSISGKEYKLHIQNEELVGIDEFKGRNTEYKPIYTDENKRELYNLLLSGGERRNYNQVIITLLATGLVKDKIGKEFFPKLAFRKSQFPMK